MVTDRCMRIGDETLKKALAKLKERLTTAYPVMPIREKIDGEGMEL